MKKLEWHSPPTREFMMTRKDEWGAGPWQSEPDKMQWTDPATGLPCLIVRNNLGALCGYVGVPVGHPLFGPDAKGDSDSLEVHGGVNFAGFCSPHATEAEGICHVSDDDAPVWWLGFDCAHGFDLAPAMRAFEKKTLPPMPRPPLPERYRDVYRDVSYVQEQCAGLARQLAEMK